MTVIDNIRKQRRLRAAEGYLDLIMVFADRWPLDAEKRDRLAHRALEHLDRFPPDDHYLAHVAFLRGQAFRAMERYSDAIEPLQEAAALEPENIHAHLALGWCFKRIERIDLAIQALEDAIEVAPDEGIIHYNLACYWSLADNKGLAIQYLLQSFDLDDHYRELVAEETDFDPIRDDPEFQMFTGVIA